MVAAPAPDAGTTKVITDNCGKARLNRLLSHLRQEDAALHKHWLSIKASYQGFKLVQNQLNTDTFRYQIVGVNSFFGMVNQKGPNEDTATEKAMQPSCN